MKYGSMTNATLANTRYPADYMPKEGDGATLLHWSDRTPFTIVSVQTSSRIIVKQDRILKAAGGEWVMKTNPLATPIFVTLRKNGTWIRMGESMKSGDQFIIDKRLHFRDPNF